MAQWRSWIAAPRPVAADAHVECLTHSGRRAHGVAVAFNWDRPHAPDLVAGWRHHLPDSREPAPERHQRL